MASLRVLVVEDSLTVRRRIVEVLSADPGLEVVAEAASGIEGIALCERLRPDVATFDMVLPGATGLAATEHIMAYFPTPIVIVSASTNRGELMQTYEALAAGAVDVLEKPRGDEPEGVWEAKLVATVKLAGKIKVITHPRARLRDRSSGHADRPSADALRAAGRVLTPIDTPVAPPPRASTPSGRGRVRAIGIGASTGGPGAVLDILRALPADFPVPILLVIHIGAAFAGSLAEWLDGHSRLRVGYAREGERLPPIGHGRVIMAPPDRHIRVEQGRLVHSAEAERNYCRPSVDVLFESMAADLGGAAAACLLTGMGRDGAAGMLALRRAGAHTIAQDEASSVVFGMPREAIQLGAAQRVLPLQLVPRALVELAFDARAGAP